MAWLEVMIPVHEKNRESEEDFFWALGALAITYLDAGDVPILEPAPNTTPVWEDAILKALFDAQIDTVFVQAQLSERYPSLQLALNPLEDRDWTRVWMENYKPMVFGDRLLVCPAWLEPPREDLPILNLEPGMAFGTGTHPTTAMCLEALTKQEVIGASVLDFGCGSGILGIAAALLGADKIWGVDHCDQAVQSMQQNAERNALSTSQIQAVLPNDLPDDFIADILLANILAGPLHKLSDVLLSHMRPGGILIVSGILSSQVADLIQVYEPRCQLMDRLDQEDWSALVFKLTS